VFTDSAEPMLAAEATHRDHAIVEQVIADLKDSALAHLPSGVFTANAAWLVCAAIAHNLAICSPGAWCLGRTTMPSRPSVPHWGVEQRKRVYARTRLPMAGRSCQRASAGVDRALREHRQAKAESTKKARPPGRRSQT
jgi:hypothetical protein